MAEFVIYIVTFCLLYIYYSRICQFAGWCYCTFIYNYTKECI